MPGRLEGSRLFPGMLEGCPSLPAPQRSERVALFGLLLGEFYVVRWPSNQAPSSSPSSPSPSLRRVELIFSTPAHPRDAEQGERAHLISIDLFLTVGSVRGREVGVLLGRIVSAGRWRSCHLKESRERRVLYTEREGSERGGSETSVDDGCTGKRSPRCWWLEGERETGRGRGKGARGEERFQRRRVAKRRKKEVDESGKKIDSSAIFSLQAPFLQLGLYKLYVNSQTEGDIELWWSLGRAAGAGGRRSSEEVQPNLPLTFILFFTKR